MKNIVQWKNTFPRSVINSKTFDELLDTFFESMETPEMASLHLFGKDQVVPYDVIQVKNDKGEIIGTEISYTLAGYSPSEVEVEIDSAKEIVTVRATKTTKKDESKYQYIRKGIAQRNIEVSYHIEGIDKDNITATHKDGMLTLFLPVLPEKQVQQSKRKLKLLEG